MFKNLGTIRKITSNRHFWPIVLVLFFAWLASRTLFGSGYFNMHDDLQMMRQLEMEKCFLDLQIPCRWVPDMGYGFGYPLFNFYPPLPYLVGQVYRLIGYSFVDTAKALFITAFFASGITMYAFGQKFFGRVGGVLASVFYIWAPYHSVDIFVRGAMNESWGLIWFPLILLFSYLLISKKQTKVFTLKNTLTSILGLALSWFALLTSHNLMVIIFTPFFALWCLVWLIYFKNWKVIPSLVFSGVSSFALAAFFTLPVFLEKNIVQTNTLITGYYEYTAHFPSARQLFISRFWGYGPSVWLENDGMSFQIGWLHWILPLFVVAFLGLRFLRRRKLTNVDLSVICMFVVGWIAAFMDHPRSTPIWAHIQALQFIQFPWRYLTMIILGFSFVVGALAVILPRFIRFLIILILLVGVVAYSWNFFLPEHGHLGSLTDEEKFTAAAWDLQQTAGIYDYLPNTAITAPHGPRKVQAEIMDGVGKVVEGTHGTDWEKFSVEAQNDVTVRISVLQFPTWVVTVDGKEVPVFVPSSEQWGRLYINVPAGKHEVYANLHSTPVRTAGNIISLISWLSLIAFLLYRYRLSTSNKKSAQNVTI